MTRALWALTAASLATALACGLYFVASTIATRLPYWGEAEVIFEASRLRAGLPLFVDPLLGAHELGEPPSRFYVTYPPLWAAVVALVPAGAAILFGRIAATLAWLGALAAIAGTAPRESRLNAIASAAFVGGMWILLNFATVARPDSIACALAAFGLVRAMREGRIDLLSGACLVLVPWVKPTILGLPAGAFVADAVARRAKAPILVAAAVTAVIAMTLHLWSGGQLFAHVARSNAQPFTAAAWLEHVPSRLPFFAPLFALAAWAGWRDRRAPGSAIGLGALVAAAFWVLVALAKTGSASNYWMEPCVAAVALVANAAPTGFRFGVSGAPHAAVALASALWADVAAVRGSLEHAKEYRADADFVATLPEICGAGGSRVVVADEAGVELVVDRRILTPTYQMVWLANEGRYPVETWIGNLDSMWIACVVEHTGQLRLSPALARAIDARFAPALEQRGWRVLLPRPTPSLQDTKVDTPPDR